MSLDQPTPAASETEQPFVLPADGPVVVLDTETTGLDHRTEKIIEIAALRLENGVITDTFHTMVNPEQPIRSSSFKIHNISDAMIADAPTMETVLPKLLDFMGDLPMVAHNAIFDYSFISMACKQYLGHRLPNRRICTLEMFRSVFPEEHSHGLSAMSARFGFEAKVNHRALDDAEQLAKAYPLLRELYVQKHQWQLNQLRQVPYLFERFLRLQKTIQLLQAEQQDLKELFKLYFAENQPALTASTGEMLSMGYRRSYTYDNDQLMDVLKKHNLYDKATKVNQKAIDRWLSQNPERTWLTAEQRQELLATRRGMQQTLMVNINRPVVEEEDEALILDTEASDLPESQTA